MKYPWWVYGLIAGCHGLSSPQGSHIAVHLASGFRALGGAKGLSDIDHIRVDLRSAGDDSLRASTRLSLPQGSEVLFEHVPDGTYYAVAEAFESGDDSLSITKGGPQRSLNDVSVLSPGVSYSASDRLEIQMRLFDDSGSWVNVETSGLEPGVSFHTWLFKDGDLLAPDVRSTGSFRYQGLPSGTYRAVASIWPTTSHSTVLRPSLEDLALPQADTDPVPIFHIAIPGLITTIADSGAASGDLLGPTGVVADTNGNIYMADSAHNRIRMRTASGTFVTVAGTGAAGFGGDGGAAVAAQLKAPEGLVLNAQGELYVSDTGNHRIRKIANGLITTVAGTGSAGYGGDGGPAFASQLSAPSGLALRPNGDLLIADVGNNRIRQVASGVITTLAGTGHQSVLRGPKGVDALLDGRILIADTGNNQVKVFSGGLLTVIAGTGNGGYTGDGDLAVLAKLNNPSSVKMGPFGDILIADTGNQRIRRLEGAIISSVAGAGGAGLSGDGGPAYLAGMKGPSGLWIAENGVVYVADTKNDRIRRLD